MTVDAREDRLQVRGISFESLFGGSGEPVLVLHDIDYLNRWQPFQSELAADFSLTVPSHPGFGASELPPDVDSVDDLAYVYLDLLRQTGAQHVVGLGFGGWIAAEMAVRCDDEIRSLTLVDALGIKVGDRLTRDIADTFVIPPREFLKLAWDDPEAGAAAMSLAGLSQLSEADAVTVMRNRQSAALFGWNPFMHNPKLLGRLQRIRVPALVLWGASDRIVTPDYGLAFAAAIPGAQFSVIDSAGHYPYLEKPTEFVAMLRSFLKRK